MQKVMTALTGTYDHRVIQGAESGGLPAPGRRASPGADGFYDDVFAALEVDDMPPDRRARGGDRRRAGARRDRAGRQRCRCRSSAGRPGGHLPGQGPSHARPSGRAPRPARLGPARRSGPRAETVKLTEELMRRMPASVLRVAVPGDTFADALPGCARPTPGRSRTRSSTSPTTSSESGCGRPSSRAPTASRSTRQSAGCSAASRRSRRSRATCKAFLGKKFSIEGLDALVPMLDEAIELGSADGAREWWWEWPTGAGSTCSRTVGRPYGRSSPSSRSRRWPSTPPRRRGTGDVKYRYGASGTCATLSGRGVTVTSPRTRAIEYVNPVIEGRVRAPTRRAARRATSA